MIVSQSQEYGIITEMIPYTNNTLAV